MKTYMSNFLLKNFDTSKNIFLLQGAYTSRSQIVFPFFFYCIRLTYFRLSTYGVLGCPFCNRTCNDGRRRDIPHGCPISDACCFFQCRPRAEPHNLSRSAAAAASPILGSRVRWWQPGNNWRRRRRRHGWVRWGRDAPTAARASLSPHTVSCTRAADQPGPKLTELPYRRCVTPTLHQRPFEPAMHASP
jgi:hypothetical protein